MIEKKDEIINSNIKGLNWPPLIEVVEEGGVLESEDCCGLEANISVLGVDGAKFGFGTSELRKIDRVETGIYENLHFVCVVHF